MFILPTDSCESARNTFIALFDITVQLILVEFCPIGVVQFVRNL